MSGSLLFEKKAEIPGKNLALWIFMSWTLFEISCICGVPDRNRQKQEKDRDVRSGGLQDYGEGAEISTSELGN